MWLLVFALIGSLALLLAGAACCRRRAARIDPAGLQALHQWHPLPPDQRLSVFNQAAHHHPDSGAIWYLFGLAALAQNDLPQAIRAFQVCYHREPAFQTAALLVFACQKLLPTHMDRLLPCLIETWHEMNRPRLQRHPRERRLLTELGAGPPPPNASPFAQSLWQMPLPQLHQQLHAVLTAQAAPPWALPLIAAR